MITSDGNDYEFDKGNVYTWARVRAPKSESLAFVWQENDSTLQSKKYSVLKNINGYRIYDQLRFIKEGRYEVQLNNSKNKIIGSQSFTME